MELWIRSRDKMILSKISNLKIAEDIPISPNSTVVYSDCIINETGEILGDYRNTKRALEVLDEIQNLLQPKIIYTQKEPIETFELGVYQLKQDVDMKIQEINRIVYEMPQD